MKMGKKCGQTYLFGQIAVQAVAAATKVLAGGTGLHEYHENQYR